MQHHAKIPSHIYNAIKGDPITDVIGINEPTITKTRHLLSWFTGNTITSTYMINISDENVKKMTDAYYARSELHHIMHRKRVHTTLIIILLLSIIFTLFIGLYIKPTIQHESWEIFIKHFTNWSWMFQCVFYISILICFMFFSHTKILDILFGYFYTHLAGTVCSVAIMVFLNMGALEQYWIFQDSSISSSSMSSDASSSYTYEYYSLNYFLDTFSTFRPDQSSPFDINPYIQNVLIGSELYHTFPVIFFLLVSIFMFKYIKRSFYYVYAGYSKSELYPIRIILLFSPVLFMAIYASIFDPLAVYHVKGPLMIGLLLIAVISAIVNYCILNFFMPCPVPRYLVSKNILQMKNYHNLKTFRDDENNLYAKLMNFINTDKVHLYYIENGNNDHHSHITRKIF